MPLGLKQLRYFVAIADAGALSRAATAMSVAQSALSHHVAEMETTLGVALLERKARGIALTQAGKRLYDHANAILSALAKAEIDVRNVADNATGLVSVGLSHTVTEVVSLDIMRAVQIQWPHVRLAIVEGLSDPLVIRLLAGELDVAVVYNPPLDKRLLAVPVLEENLYLVGQSQFVGSKTEAVPFADIPNKQLLGMNRFRTSRSILQSQHLRDMIGEDVTLEIDSLNAMRKALGAGLGCSILAKATVRDMIADRTIYARLIKEPEITRQLHVVTLADHPETRARHEVIAILLKSIREAVSDGRWDARIV